MDGMTAIALGVALALLGLIVAGAAVAIVARRRSHADLRLDETGRALEAGQHELAGRIAQLTEDTRAAQAGLVKSLEERLDKITHRLGDSLEQNAAKTAKTMGELQSRLAVIDEAQKNITKLSTEVVGLQDILSNKQARGAFGEIQLNDLVRAALPPSAYGFQETLSNNCRADCLIRLPNPPGPIVIDAKFPLESYRALRNAPDDAARDRAGKAFAADVTKHVRAIAERYIVPGETAESALMFLPSEAVYAELYANFAAVIDRSHREKVWIVSPTTLMATLHTVRAVLKDAQMREQTTVIQKEIATLMKDIARLGDRVGSLRRHFDQANEDVRQIAISADKITSRADRIEEVQLGEPAAEPAVLAPRPERLSAG